MGSLTTGFLLILFAAVCGGAFALPIKLRKRFELENLYALAALFTMIVLPFIVAALYLPHWQEAIAGVSRATMWRGLAFGFAWGLGAITFGYAISLVGLSIGYAIIMGINTAIGSILPFLAQSSGSIFQPASLVVLCGIAGCVVGVAICGRAAYLRERAVVASAAAAAAGGQSVTQDGASRKSSNFGLGILMCAISGVLSACANLGFAFTSQVGEQAQQLGASPVISGLGSWMLVYWGGFLATILWFGGLQMKKGTWRNNFGPRATHDLGLAVWMGVLWFLAMIPYGMGAYYLGRLGTSVGWAINIAASLILANLLGFLTGEWSTAPRRARNVLFAGLAVLVLAMAVLGRGNAMATSSQANLNTLKKLAVVAER